MKKLIYFFLENKYFPLISGLVLGAASWAIVPLVSNKFEPMDSELAFYLGQSILSVVSFYFGYSYGLKHVLKYILGIYISCNVYSYIFGTDDNRGWAILGLITFFLFLCIIPLAFGILGKLTNFGKRIYNNWIKKEGVAKQIDQ